METYDWSRFQLRIPIRQEKQTIFRLCTTQNGLESWFLRKASFTKPSGAVIDRDVVVEAGDTYEWLWFGFSDDVIERGTVLEQNGLDRFRFIFGKAGNVTIHLKEEGGELLVELTQDEIPSDENSRVNYHIGCSKGWLFYLANLKSIAEGGIDLRNKNMQLKDVISS